MYQASYYYIHVPLHLAEFVAKSETTRTDHALDLAIRLFCCDAAILATGLLFADIELIAIIAVGEYLPVVAAPVARWFP